MLGQVFNWIKVVKCVYRKSKMNDKKELLGLKSLCSINSVLCFYGNVSYGNDGKNFSIISFLSIFLKYCPSIS